MGTEVDAKLRQFTGRHKNKVGARTDTPGVMPQRGEKPIALKYQNKAAAQPESTKLAGVSG